MEWRRIPYGEDDRRLQSVDVLGGVKSVRAARLWFVFVHGGAWRDPNIDSKDGHALLSGVHEHTQSTGVPNAFAFASIDYRLSPAIKHPSHLEDVNSALLFLTKLSQETPRFVIIGHSAGAFLALQSVASISDRVHFDTLILASGIYDLRDLIDEYPDYSRMFVEEAFGIKHDGATDYTIPIDPNPIEMLKLAQQNPSLREKAANVHLAISYSEQDELLSTSQAQQFCHRLQTIGMSNYSLVRIKGSHYNVPKRPELVQICTDIVDTVELG